MKEEVKKEWCDALRSGKYKQGKGYLCNEGSFCCLGVLCDISGLGEWRGENIKTYLSRAAFLPERVNSWAGIVEYSNLIYANDTGKTFEEIASLIENEL